MHSIGVRSIKRALKNQNKKFGKFGKSPIFRTVVEMRLFAAFLNCMESNKKRKRVSTLIPCDFRYQILMAPRKKPVLSCQFSCLRALEIASQNYIKNATKNLISNPEGGGGGIKELELESSIKNVQKYLFHGMPKCLSSRITQSFLNSLQDWLLQQNMHHQDQQIELKDSIYIGLRLAEVIAHEHLEELDLSRVPKQIRSCLYGCMKKCPNLKSLHMGSGHGGWLSDSFCNRFYAPSLDLFTHLVTLRFQHDCTDHLLALVIQRNFPTLKIIDVSFSQNVSDASSEDLTMCSNLQELDLVGSGVTTKAVVFILSKCQKLVKVNAVKLAQVLEHLQPHQKVSLQGTTTFQKDFKLCEN